MFAELGAGAAVLAAAGGATGLQWWQTRQQERLASSWTVLECYLPAGATGRPESFFTSAWGKLGRSWWYALRDGRPWVSMELWGSASGVKQVMAVPRAEAVFMRQLLAHTYPGVEVVEAPADALTDWTPTKGHGLAAATIHLGRHYAYALDDGAPAAEALHSMLTHLHDQEQVWVQILLRPVPDRVWKAEAQKVLREAEQGRPPTDWTHQVTQALDHGLQEIVNGLDRATGTRPTPVMKPRQAPVRLDKYERQQLQTIPDKLKGHAFDVTLRLVAASPHAGRAHALVNNLTAVTTQLHDGNYLRVKRRRPTRKFLAKFRRRIGPLHWGRDLMTTAEVAALAKLTPPPAESANGPRILSRNPAPPLQPGEIVIGYAEVRGQRQPVGLTIEDLKRHSYLIGGMGSGKSTTLAGFALEVIKQGYGCSVLDPDGQTAKTILAAIPRERWDDVIYVELGNEEWATPLNLLGHRHPGQKLRVVEELVNLFQRLFQAGWGPASEEQLRCAGHAVADTGGTVIEIRRMLTDADFRQSVVPRIKHPEVRSYFASWDAPKDGSSSFSSRNVAPLQNKLRQFLTNEAVMAMVGQAGTLDFDEVVNEGKILIVNLDKGRNMQDPVRLIGSVIFAKLQVAGMARSHLPESQRRIHFIFADEFQNFCDTGNQQVIETMFTEMRKYCMPLLAANQYTDQLGDEIMGAIKANVGTKMVLRTGDEDARLMARLMGDPLTEADMMGLPNWQGYARVLYRGTPSRPFTFYSPPPVAQLHAWEELARHSWQKYARPYAEAEKEVNDRYGDEQQRRKAGW